ncbi:MAG: lipopolysaccharide transport periplasmic protein LptA [Gammaproteobacteria bacterium]|nr:lipopolysaccharide transport periplasmic protein LptA [Gammaproteobacteria bacterium]
MNPKLAIKLLLALSMLKCMTSWGLISDNNQLLHVTSNQATIDFTAGQVIYSGNVAASQGSRHLSGNTLMVNKAKTGGAQDVTAYGNPAKTHYQPTPQSQIAYGQAQIITYIFPSHIFKFQKEARLDQNNNIFTGPLIIYNTNTKVVHSPTNSLEPTTIILPPYNQERAKNDSSS